MVAARTRCGSTLPLWVRARRAPCCAAATAACCAFHSSAAWTTANTSAIRTGVTSTSSIAELPSSRLTAVVMSLIRRRRRHVDVVRLALQLGVDDRADSDRDGRTHRGEDHPLDRVAAFGIVAAYARVPGLPQSEPDSELREHG